MKSLKESLLDVDGDTNFDEKMIINQFFNSIESQQHIIKYLQGLIEKSSEPIASFNVVKNDRFSDSMYVVFPKKQTANGYHIVFIKQAHRGIRLWRAYGDTILDQILVSASEAGYGLGPRSNYIYKVPESMRDLFEKIINKSVRESILDNEIMSKYEELGNMKNLRESLLDDPETLVKKSDNNIYVKKIKQLIANAGEIDDDGYDFFGRKLSVGDCVLWCDANHEYTIEIISNIKKKIGDIYWVTIGNKVVPSWEVILIPTNKLKDFYEIIKQ